ncbi:MAG: glycine oxidase ThiO [Pyrinomonadaceae bacterium]|nr:glycine oxidase ThiO [Pyrinomonadaceae bacterium]
MNSEVLIIGGGVIGLSIAREIHRNGITQITILERGKIGQESSYAAAGMLAPNAETGEAGIFTDFCTESLSLYAQFAENLFAETGVDIELDRHGTLFLSFTEKDSAELLHRYEWQKKAGLKVEHLSAQETRKSEPFVSPDVRESLFFPNDWQVENRKLLHALRKYAELNGIEIREDAEIKNILSENGKVVGAETENEKFLAENVVLATGAWTSFIKAENLQMPVVKPIRGQMIAFQTAKRLFEKVIYSSRGYLVPRADGRILIGATVEDAGFDKNIYDLSTEILREAAIEIAPSLGNLQIYENWAGLRPFANNGLPIIGNLPHAENLFIATAHYRNGILLAPLTAKIIAEKLAANRNSEYLEFFRPQQARSNDLSLNISI